MAKQHPYPLPAGVKVRINNRFGYGFPAGTEVITLEPIQNMTRVPTMAGEGWPDDNGVFGWYISVDQYEVVEEPAEILAPPLPTDTTPGKHKRLRLIDG